MEEKKKERAKEKGKPWKISLIGFHTSITTQLEREEINSRVKNKLITFWLFFLFLELRCLAQHWFPNSTVFNWVLNSLNSTVFSLFDFDSTSFSCDINEKIIGSISFNIKPVLITEHIFKKWHALIIKINTRLLKSQSLIYFWVLGQKSVTKYH